MGISFSDAKDERVLTSASFQNEDMAEVSLRPRLINEFIGQEKAKENLAVFIKAAKKGANPWITCFYMALPALAKPHWQR